VITYLIIEATAIVSFVCFDRRDLLNKLSFNPYAVFKHNEWYRILTHGFVHADTIHLLVNMFTLFANYRAIGIEMGASLCKQHHVKPRRVYHYYLNELKALMTEGVEKKGLPNNQQYNEGSTLTAKPEIK